VDLINLMTYDFHTAGETVTGLNSPLYGSSSINSSVVAWLDAGVDASKLTISVPFYGHSYSLASESNHEVGAPATTGIGGPYTQSPGVLGYNEVPTDLNDAKDGNSNDGTVADLRILR
jgi:chitinase